MYYALAILLTFAFFYTVSVGKIEKLPVSGASIFLIIGIILGPLGFSILDFDGSPTTIRILADLTLAMLLYLLVLKQTYTNP